MGKATGSFFSWLPVSWGVTSERLLPTKHPMSSLLGIFNEFFSTKISTILSDGRNLRYARFVDWRLAFYCHGRQILSDLLRASPFTPTGTPTFSRAGFLSIWIHIRLSRHLSRKGFFNHCRPVQSMASSLSLPRHQHVFTPYHRCIPLFLHLRSGPRDPSTWTNSERAYSSSVMPLSPGVLPPSRWSSTGPLAT